MWRLDPLWLAALGLNMAFIQTLIFYAFPGCIDRSVARVGISISLFRLKGRLGDEEALAVGEHEV
jgi:hypothetical protein